MSASDRLSHATASQPAADDLKQIEHLRQAYQRIRDELSKVIVGQSEVLDLLLIALFSRGHVILEGVPGLAKTLMISSLAKCLGLKFQRIQFTPDLMPSDITGTEIIQEDRATGQRSLRFMYGPIFTQVLLADEVNRTPPKTQAALLEAMQEEQVTVNGVRHELEPPFFVLATQNPIDQEGTYPLPEAQQDRFMFKVLVGYPSYDEEYQIAARFSAGPADTPQPVLGRDEILALQSVVRRVPVPESVIHYALDLVRMTRPSGQLHAELPARAGRAAVDPKTSNLIDRTVLFGAGPRAVQFLLLGAKARAAIQGRSAASIADIRTLAFPVLRHRILTTYAAEAEGVSIDQIISQIQGALEASGAEEQQDGGIRQVLKA